MKGSVWLAACAGTAWLSACGSSQKSQPVAASPEAAPPGHGLGLDGFGSSQTPITEAEWRVIADGIGRLLAADDGCPGDACPKAAGAFVPPDVSLGRADHVILVLDGGDSVAAGLRYAHRVLGRFHVTEAGTLEETRPEYVVPADAYAIYRSLDLPGRILPQALTDGFANAFVKKYYDPTWSPGVASHMNQVFNLLTSYVPQAYYVLVDTKTVDEAGAADLCSLSSAARQRIRGRYRRLAAQMGQVMDRYGVDFVNLSGGYARDQLTANGWFGCDRMPLAADVDEFLKVTADYVEDLASHPGVTLVQAGVTSESPLRPDDLRAPGDCREVAGRVRAGFFLAKTSGLGPFGRLEAGTPPALPEYQQAAAACIDLFVNFGFELDAQGDEHPGGEPVQSGAVGLDFHFRGGVEPETSWAAPLLLAHLIYLQDQVTEAGGSRLTAAALLDAARGGDRTVRLVDPLKHGQVPTLSIK